VKFSAARNKHTVKKPVPAVVTELLKIKESRGASDRYRADLASRLNRFAAIATKTVATSPPATFKPGWILRRRTKAKH